MKILVLAQNYPSQDNPYAMSYVHSRNVEYKKLGHEVKVVNFSETNEYKYDLLDICVFSKKLLDWPDVIVSHAPNIKNHVKALREVRNKKIIFFFHGHEVLHQYGDYPQPYSWKKQKLSRKLFIKIYDHLKMSILRKFFKDFSKKNSIGFVFVSSWMERQFLKNIKLNPQETGLSAIIPNACNAFFLDTEYKFDQNEKLADCITIRPLDDSKYAVDLVVQAALNNPEKEFHIYCKGDFFSYNKKPNNVTVINKFIQQKDIPELLNKYHIAMMPTRYDAQGVMVCEMATYGIPVITTDFEVCVEMLSDFENVQFVNEDSFKELKFDNIVKMECEKNSKFSPNILINKELGFFNEL